MSHVLRVITIDVKQKKQLINFVVSLISVIAFILLFITKIGIKSVPLSFLGTSAYIFLITFSLSLTQDFSNKTDKMVFTGIFTRHEIIISKEISFVAFSLIAFVIYEILSAACGTFDSNKLGNVLIAFVLFAFVLGAFILLLSVISGSLIVTGIAGYICFFDLIEVLLANVMESSKNEIIKAIISNLPFYIAKSGFNDTGYSLHQAYVMICSGLIALVLSCVIMNRKNI